jgi:hypothetical protein
MSWEDILKDKRGIKRRAKQTARTKGQTRFAFGHEPVPKGMRDKQVWKPKTVAKPSRRVEKPKQEVRDSGGEADASDVLPPLRELRAEWLKDPRGIYGELSDKVFKLGAVARKEPRRQKKILGYIRKIIREANITEGNL